MSEPSPSSPGQRLQSLDALRGFDMCWILGLGGLTIKVLDRFHVAGRAAIIDQLEHVPWAGFHAYDLIFPLFLFIAGVSLSLALPKRLAAQGHAITAGKLILRAAILFFIGVIYSGGFQKGLAEVRWLGVLQRIALASCGAGLLSLWLRPRGLVLAAIALLALYWALLTFVPVPGTGAGNYAEGRNLTNHIDRVWLPGRKYDGDHDPEGILSTLPAIATALLGILSGHWVSGPAPAGRKVAGLIGGGLLLVALGWGWGWQFPVVKKLWTSSFVLVAGGWSAILFGLFYLVIDVAKVRWWTPPFVWIGANPILLYVCSGLGYFRILTERLTVPLKGESAWIPAAISFALVLLTARFLYKRGIFIRA